MKKVSISLECNDNTLKQGASALEKKLDFEIADNGIKVCAEKSANLAVYYDDGGYIVRYGIPVEFYRGLAICLDLIRGGKEKGIISEKRCFDTCGVMLDVSRNMVVSVETAKDLIEYMALMGLNMLMLYTEDTYKIDKYPYFGYMRGAYTKEEIKEIDKYAAMFGIELIPCIQTLSHLATALRWNYTLCFADTGRTLYVGRQETYDFIEEMFKTVKECFSSKRIHVGLDESFDVGMGDRLKKEGYTPALELMQEHLKRVCALAEKYGLSPMMWSDMFFKSGKIGGDYDYTTKIPAGFHETIPKNIELVYWDYCMEKPEITDLFLKRHRDELKRKTIFAGGIWTWNRMTANYDKTFITSNAQLESCKNNNINEVFVTIWDNTTSMFNLYSVLPGLQLWAEHFYCDKPNLNRVKKMFKICTGYKYDDFMLLGFDDFTFEEKKEYADETMFCINSSAQHFFNDILIGLFDKTLGGFDFVSHYQKYCDGLKKVKYKGNIGDMFLQGKILSEILVRKAKISRELTEAYKKSDMEEFKKYVAETEDLLVLYEEYHKISRDIWYKQNKPFGWEGCDIILGGAEARIKTAINRLKQYAEGEIKSIPELEEERLYYNGISKPLTETGGFIEIMTAGVV